MAYRPRLWHMIVAIIVISILSVLMAGMLRQRQGLARLHQIAADRHAAGQIGSLADLIATLPATDADLQSQWWAWSQVSVKGWVDPKYDDQAYQDWIAGTGPFPQSIADTLAVRAPSVQLARDMLQHDDLLLSGAGWLRTHLTNPKYTLTEAAALPLPNLLVQRDLAQWLRHAAVLAEDPRPYLHDFDRLIHASLHPVTLIDAMILVALLHIRDQAYVETAMRGTLPADMAKAWIADVQPILHSTGGAILSEGILYSVGFAHSIGSGQQWSLGRDVFGRNTVSTNWDMWWNGATDSAQMFGYYGKVRDRLQGLTSTPLPDFSTEFASGGQILSMLVPNCSESIMTVLEYDATQRAMRLAVLLLNAYPAADLPADVLILKTQPEYLALLQPPGDAYYLIYERLAQRRMRICISPTSPVPNIAIPGRLTYISKVWGTPAAKAAVVWSRNGSLELEIPLGSKAVTP